MSKQESILLTAKIDYGSAYKDAEWFGMAVMTFGQKTRNYTMIQPHTLGEHEFDFKKNPQPFLKKALKTLDPKKAPQLIYVGDFQTDGPHYFLLRVAADAPKEKLLKAFREKVLTGVLYDSGCMPENAIKPLSKEEQDIVDAWEAGNLDG